MRDGVRYAIAGVALGLIASVVLTRWMSSMLFGVTPTDPLTYILLAGVMLLVGALAAFLPARRALKVDPVIALRGEA